MLIFKSKSQSHSFLIWTRFIVTDGRTLGARRFALQQNKASRKMNKKEGNFSTWRRGPVEDSKYKMDWRLVNFGIGSLHSRVKTWWATCPSNAIITIHYQFEFQKFRLITHIFHLHLFKFLLSKYTWKKLPSTYKILPRFFSLKFHLFSFWHSRIIFLG